MIRIHSAFMLIFIVTVPAFALDSPPSSAGKMKVYFTEPERNGRSAMGSAPETALIAIINAAQAGVDGAFYEIGSERVADAFIRAHKRGVAVRLVTDDSNLDEPALKAVISAGISVVNDGKKGLMHDKFAVVDGRTVWTGSYNITNNCAYRNNNNAISIESPELAAIYEAEFAEMFEGHIFQNRKERKALAGISNPYYVKVEETDINAYFSPDNDIEPILVKRIEKAKSSIYFLAFSFTSDPIGEAMIDAHKKGIRVEGVFEKNGSDTAESEYKKLLVEGLPVALGTVFTCKRCLICVYFSPEVTT
ncbi:MAG: phospholipase D-like domain-containing protein [Spirochaetota bacterium]